MMWSLSIMHMVVFLASSLFQRWSLLSFWKYLGAGPLLGPCPCPRPFFEPCFLLVLDCWGGGGDWFPLLLLLPPFHLAASWAARVAVSVWCLAMVVFTRPVRVEFSALVRLWWVDSSLISWSRTFCCFSSTSTWFI